MNRLAVGRQTDEDLKAFNHNVTEKPPEGAIVLAERHVQVNRFNKDALDRIPGEMLCFPETRHGSCKKSKMESGYPPVVHLKENCKVVIKVNGKCTIDKMDHEYVNGDVCRFSHVDSRERLILFRDVDGQEIRLSRDKAGDNRGDVKEVEVENEDGSIEIVKEPCVKRAGYIEQYPITLAYAQTAASCQGRTIERLHVCMPPGPFQSMNMLYVVLSRCTSIGNISLNRPLTHADCKTTMIGRMENIQQYELEI